MCAMGDSNPHSLRNQILSLARLPITPIALFRGCRCVGRAALCYVGCAAVCWRHCAVLLNESVFTEYFAEFLEGELYLLFGVGGHEREADEGVLRRYGGSHHGVHEETFVEEVACHVVGLVVVADVEGDDGGRCCSDFASHLAEAFESEVGDVPEVLLAPGFLLHDVDCLECGGGGGGGDGGGEYVGA